MTEHARKVLTQMRDQFRMNHNDERADALDEALMEGQWIDCAVNPPKPGKEVLFTRIQSGREPVVRIGRLDHVTRNGYGRFNTKEGRYKGIFRCKVWMPLPEIYVDEEFADE